LAIIDWSDYKIYFKDSITNNMFPFMAFILFSMITIKICELYHKNIGLNITKLNLPASLLIVDRFQVDFEAEISVHAAVPSIGARGCPTLNVFHRTVDSLICG
jgi:hypothetical protein